MQLIQIILYARLKIYDRLSPEHLILSNFAFMELS